MRWRTQELSANIRKAGPYLNLCVRCNLAGRVRESLATNALHESAAARPLDQMPVAHRSRSEVQSRQHANIQLPCIIVRVSRRHGY